MSSTASIAAVGALFLLVLAPLAVALDRERAVRLTRPLLAGYALLFAALAIYEISPFQTREKAVLSTAGLTATSEPGMGTTASAQCAQAVSQSEVAGLILDRRNPGRVIVNGRFWNQIPEQAQEALIYCLEQSRARDANSRPVEIVERNGG